MIKNSNSNQRFYIWIAILGAVFLALSIVFSFIDAIDTGISSLIMLFLYAAACVTVFFLTTEKPQSIPTEDITVTVQDIREYFKLLDKSRIPTVQTKQNGEIIACNSCAIKNFNIVSLSKGRNVSFLADFCPGLVENIRDLTGEKTSWSFENAPTDDGKVSGKETFNPHEISLFTGTDGYYFSYNNKMYIARCAEIRVKADAGSLNSARNTAKGGRKKTPVTTVTGAAQPEVGGQIILKQYILTFTDVTAVHEFTEKVYGEDTVVGYIVIDNLEELAQYIRVSYRSAVSQIEDLLMGWVVGMGGILREYDRDKYIFIINRKSLRECIDGNFEILSKIRNVKLGDSSVPITVSMGISSTFGSFKQRGEEADAALDFALQRGGDQIAVNDTGHVIYFGGRTKSITQKASAVTVKFYAEYLAAIMEKSSNVLIMGHKNPDFDCIGACLGIARFAEFCGVSGVRIITDPENSNFKVCTSKLLLLDEFSGIFINANRAQQFVENDTLLVVVDVNNTAAFESSDILKLVRKTVIIDHHRKKDFEQPENCIMSWIESGASSTCELIANMLQIAMPENVLTKEEATVMLSGIALDTKNFTRSTSSKTFNAARYLRDAGASPETVSNYFKESPDNYLAELRFFENMLIYNDTFAIAAYDGVIRSNSRVAAARVAEKLLDLQNVEAGFALITDNGNVFISARSNGKINVQLIMEKLNGGGHYDSAGAARFNTTIEKVISELEVAIDEYIATDKNQ